jgi:hypothetical protein
MANDPTAGTALGERDIELHCVIALGAGNRVIANNIRTTMIRVSRYTI